MKLEWIRKISPDFQKQNLRESIQDLRDHGVLKTSNEMIAIDTKDANKDIAITEHQSFKVEIHLLNNVDSIHQPNNNRFSNNLTIMVI